MFCINKKEVISMKKIALLGLLFVLGLTACGSTPAESKSSEQPASSSEITTSSENVASSSSVAPSSSSEAKSSSGQTQNPSSQVSSSSVHEHLFTPTAPIEPTCTTKGSQTYVCSCGATTTKEIDALGHDYGNMVNGYLPSYYFDGMQDYYKCSRCKQYFDANKKETTESALKLEKASDNVAVSVNGEQKGVFTLLNKDENAVTWEYKNLTVAVNDVISLTKPGDATYKYQYFGDGNIDQDGKVLTAGAVNLNLVATPNGFQLAVSGYKYQGLVVKVNENEYPLTKVTYYEDNKETYIYGYHYFNVGDKMTVVDNVNNIVYDFDDIENDTAWNTFDFHKGANNEIVFDYQARFGIEFDRGGDKKISITKTFGPNDGSAFEIDFTSDKSSVSMKEYAFDKTDDEYEEMLWYLNNENVINNSDIVEYIQTNGLKVYMATVDFKVGETFNVHNITKNTSINADHLATVYGDNTNYVTIDGNYLKITKTGSYLVEYVPSSDIIALFVVGGSVVIGGDGYLMANSSFIQGTRDNSGLVVYNNVSVSKNGYVVFMDSDYNMLSPTLDSSCDSTLVRISSGLIYLNKTGVFNFKINMETNVFFIEVVSIDEETVSIPKYLSGKGGLFKTLVENPLNSEEVYATDVFVPNVEDSFYLSFYDDSFNGIDDISLDADSVAYGAVMMGQMIYMSQNGTYNVYINKTSHVVRLVKTA